MRPRKSPGRPSKAEKLWVWVTEEWRRSGAVPPLAYVNEHGPCTGEAARRHYAAWVERGWLEMPYRGVWVIPSINKGEAVLVEWREPVGGKGGKDARRDD